MKKNLLILLALCIVFICAGCGNKTEKPQNGGTIQVPSNGETTPNGDASASYMDNNFIFGIDDKEFFFGDTVSSLKENVEFVGGEKMLKETVTPGNTKTITAYNKNALITLGVYNDTSKRVRVADCKIGYISLTSQYGHSAIKTKAPEGYEGALSMAGIKLRNINLNMGVLDLVAAIGRSTTGGNGGSSVSYHKWVRPEAEMTIFYQDGKLVTLTYQMRGIFSRLNYSDLMFKDGNVIVSRGRQYKLNTSIYDYLEYMGETKHDATSSKLQDMIDPGQICCVELCAWRGENATDDIDVYKVTLQNQGDKNDFVSNAVVIGVKLYVQSMSEMSLNSTDFIHDIKSDYTYEEVIGIIGEPTKTDGNMSIWSFKNMDLTVEFSGENGRIVSIEYMMHIEQNTQEEQETQSQENGSDNKSENNADAT